MYALVLSLVVAFALIACPANSHNWYSKRLAVNLKTIPCHRVQKSDLCQCCNVDPCEGVDCMNGGQCVGEGVCDCVSGFTGPTCSIDPCEDVECMNGGNCVGDGVCNCTFGFGGPTCNIRVCNVTECDGTGRGRCVLFRCKTNVDDCGSEQCNAANNEVCVDGNCEIEGDTCNVLIDDIVNLCADQGEQCGDGFCITAIGFFNAKCVDNECRPVVDCDQSTDGAACGPPGGMCSGGACLSPCSDDSECSGAECVGGFCALFKCGDSVCLAQ